MKRNNKKSLIIILLLLISLGYAYLNSNLKINGTAEIADNTWDIHFENVVPSSSNTVTPSIAPVANPEDKVTELTYSVRFNKPGDIYEFNVDVVNAGSIDAMVDLFTSKIKIDNGQEQDITESTLPSYMNYYVTYEDGVKIKKNQLLNASTRETITVHVEYKKDISNLELAESAGKPILFNVNIKYIQATNDGVPKPIHLSCTYEGELFPGVEYVNGQYTYRYMQESNGSGWIGIPNDGWGVVLTDKTSTDPVTTTLCSNINGKPIVSMSYMFANSKAETIDLYSFDTSNVINMDRMFQDENSVKYLDFSNFDTSKVANMNGMFNYMYNIKELDLSSFDTRNVTEMIYMITNNYNLRKIDLSSFDTSNVYNISDFLKYCPLLEEVDLSNFNLSSLNQYSPNIDMLYSYSITSFKTPMSLPPGYSINFSKKLYIGNQEYDGVYSETTSKELKAKNEAKFESGSDPFSRIIGIEFVREDLKHIKRATQLADDFTVTNSNYDLYMASITDNSSSNNQTSQYPVYVWAEEDTLYYYTKANKIYFNENSSYLFGIYPNLEDIDMEIFDTSLTTNMYQLFYGDYSLKSIDLSHFDTSNVTNMYGMFADCKSLKTIDVTGFDTSKVEIMSKMFKHTDQLESVDVSNFDTSNVTSIYEMFEYSGIKRLDVSNFDVRNASPSSFLQGADSLEELKTFKYNYNGSSYSFITVDLYERGSDTPISKDYSYNYPTETILKNHPWN